MLYPDEGLLGGKPKG